MFWSEEDKEELTGSFILDRMAADLEGFESEYNEVFVDGLFVVSTYYIQHLNIRVAKLNCVHNNAPCDVALGRFFDTCPFGSCTNIFISCNDIDTLIGLPRHLHPREVFIRRLRVGLDYRLHALRRSDHPR